MIESHPLDPVSAMVNLLQLHDLDDGAGPLLCNNRGDALKETVNYMLQETDASMQFTGHSFRKGGEQAGHSRRRCWERLFKILTFGKAQLT